MANVTLYTWDESSTYSGSTSVSPDGSIPARSTPVAPPKISTGKLAYWTGLGWSLIDKAAVSADDGKLEAARTAAFAALNADYSKAVAALTATYPGAEVVSWTMQSDEAAAYKADPSASTPFLTSLYEARKAGGIVETFAELVDKIQTKGAAYTAASATLTGRRHAAEKAIETSTDPASVSWSFALS